MSNLYEYIKMAVHNIMANKGRSFLTMLGIIIGIASVIAIVSVGEGTKNQMNSEIDDIGGGQIAISVSDEAQTDEEWITADDVEAIRAVDGIEGVNVSDSFSGETTTGKGNFSLMLTGEGPDAKLLNNATMKHGVYFGENEVQEAKNVCVLSDADAKRLFGTDDVVGMTVDVNCYGLTKSLRICGVTTQKENGTFVSYTYEGMPVTINVPYTTMNEFTGVSDYFFSVTMQADKSLNSQDVADKVVKLLEKRHQCAGKDYFQVQSFQDIMSSMNQMLDMVTAFISFVAGISLLVGGIGVMNIMLVSVTERTRIEKYNGGVAYTEDDGNTWVQVPDDTTVSMNMWGLTPEFLDMLEDGFRVFFEKEVPENPLKAEYLIPIFIGEQLSKDKMSVKVLKTNDTWYGMTYREDVAAVKDSFRKMLEKGVYKTELFSDLRYALTDQLAICPAGW